MDLTDFVIFDFLWFYPFAIIDGYSQCPITVVDFETNVKTKQGEGRYCVLFEQNGQRSKFITNCYNLKDVLDQAREAENNGQKIFPVENVIVKRRSLGDGKSAYYFEE